MVPVPSSIINDVIMKLLMMLKVINVLANFLILSESLLLEWFSLYGYFEGNLDPNNKFNNMTS